VQLEVIMRQLAITVVGILGFVAGCSTGGGSTTNSAVVTTSAAPTTTGQAVTTTATTDLVIAVAASTTAPTLAPNTIAPPPIETRWAVASPGEIDLQFHAGSPPALLLVADGGRTIMVRAAGDWAPDGTFDDVITPTDTKGGPLTIIALRSTVFLTIAVTSDGQLVQVDPWHKSAAVLPHPGAVTDVALTGLLITPPIPQPFWAVGFDQVDGLRRPVVWYDTGLVSDDQGTASGSATATRVVTGEAGGDGRPLVAGNSSAAFALLPEPDGMSRLWTLQTNSGATAQSTDLRFRDPTAVEMGGDGALWIADGDGLQVVDVLASPLKVRTVSNTPVRALNWMSAQFGFAVLVLDATGAVTAVNSSGATYEYHHDDAATDLAAMFWSGDPDVTPQLFLVHGHADEVIVVGKGLTG
jgi:hypothetical protein